VLPVVLMPLGATTAHGLGVLTFGPQGVTWFQAVFAPYLLIALFFLAGLAGYYLIWKHIIGNLNRMLGVA
jgi:hypothetical protein